MNLDDLFRPGPATAPVDDVTLRRWVSRAKAEGKRRSAGADERTAARAEVEHFEKAERALEQGRLAEGRGDVDEAVVHLTAAARGGVGDSILRLAGVLTRAQRYADALRWCLLAEAEGFDEATDLAARCRMALGLSVPAGSQQSTPVSVPPALEVEPTLRAAGRPFGSAASADLGLTRRLKALACTVPLHELDHHKAKLERVDGTPYQMAEIAMHTIDQITIAMDFDTGAARDVVEQRVRPFIAAQAPGRSTEEHQTVAGWVLHRLISGTTVDRVFRHVYGEIGADGEYRRLEFDFKLVREVPGRHGDIYLRTTDEAINVLVGALDTDVESAQIAAEVKLGNLINRGRLADARVAAEQARYRTVQYGEMLRQKLDATRRDVRVVDWEQELPDLLDKALDHIEERFKVEHAIQRNITDARDESDDPDHKRRAADLVVIVDDCIRRHSQLQSRVQSARAVFRAEQDRQQFSGPPQRAALDLFGQLLRPVLGLPIAEAVNPLEQFFQAASGVDSPDVLSLPGLVSMLLRPVTDRDRTAGPVVTPVVDEAPDTSRFTDEHRRLADALLDLPDRVSTLSSILRHAADFDEDLPVLIALRAANAYSPAVGGAILHGRDKVLIAVPAGHPIRPSYSAVEGDDLLLATSEVINQPPDDQPGDSSAAHEESA